MGKSENVRNILVIEKFLKSNNDTYSEEFKRLLSMDEGKRISEALLTFLYAEIDNIILVDDVNYIFK